MEIQKTLNSHSNLEKVKEPEESTFMTSDDTPMLQSSDSTAGAQNWKHRSMEQDRKPRNKPTDLWSINL